MCLMEFLRYRNVDWHEFNGMRSLLHCFKYFALQWRHYDHDGLSNHQPHGCLLNRLQTVFQTQIKENIKASRHWLLCGHRDRGIPRTQGQLRGKCFHLMTSSWYPAKASSLYIPFSDRPHVDEIPVMSAKSYWIILRWASRAMSIWIGT